MLAARAVAPSIARAFRMFDDDGDGRINRTDMLKALKRLNIDNVTTGVAAAVCDYFATLGGSPRQSNAHFKPSLALVCLPLTTTWMDASVRAGHTYMGFDDFARAFFPIDPVRPNTPRRCPS